MKRLRRVLLTNLVLVLALTTAAAAQTGAAWSAYGGDPGNTRFSPLNQINTANVEQLKVAWALQLGLAAVAGIDAARGRRHALRDLVARSEERLRAWMPKTGVVRWRYSPEVPAGIDQYGVLRRQQSRRGLRQRQDLRRHASTATWSRSMPRPARSCGRRQVIDYTQGSVITSPPTLVKNLVITGFGGGEYGVRGSSWPSTRTTGRRSGARGQCPGPASRATTRGRATPGSSAAPSPGTIGSYDPTLNLIYYGTSNPVPLERRRARQRHQRTIGQFTNLYTSTHAGHQRRYRQDRLALPDDAARCLGLRRRQRGRARRPRHRRAEDAGTASRPIATGSSTLPNRETGELISAKPFVDRQLGDGDRHERPAGPSRCRRSGRG